MGGTEVPIKRFVAWPQHHVLVGPDRKRPTYDSLDPFQWMAGYLKGALDLAEPDRLQNLHYLADLLQDVSDFSFDSAKACHAVVLTTMEHDKVSWQDTADLDRFRRQHAQVHTRPVQSAPIGKGKRLPQSDKSDVPCKYFNDSYCSKSETHLTKGTWYLHICSRCKGDHALSSKKCKPKN